ncbi:hypothetical protein [Streptomyces broussonetiae]|uniref:Secreted protein n=1 Tax=Streptomyces broussonetiae TaxID=2686304 RepID=A0A6I6N8N7_9ACTN|nr:hypothetical protein [Streptomyces broussonetiae]QHA04796.1 hypothetical protein GQF42_17165 [Streptomyces broussonetiae]
MRVLSARRLASTTLCAAVLAGVTCPAAVAADAAREHASSASSPATQAEEQLLVQVRALDATRVVLQPVVDLLNESLKKGRLTSEEADRLGGAARRAINEVARTAPVLPAPAAPRAPVTPGLSSTAKLPMVPDRPAVVKHADDGKAPAARDAVGDLLASLQTAVNNLLKAATSGLSTVVSAAGGVVSNLVGLLTSTLGLATSNAASPASVPNLPATG